MCEREVRGGGRGCQRVRQREEKQADKRHIEIEREGGRHRMKRTKKRVSQRGKVFGPVKHNKRI